MEYGFLNPPPGEGFPPPKVTHPISQQIQRRYLSRALPALRSGSIRGASRGATITVASQGWRSPFPLNNSPWVSPTSAAIQPDFQEIVGTCIPHAAPPCLQKSMQHNAPLKHPGRARGWRPKAVRGCAGCGMRPAHLLLRGPGSLWRACTRFLRSLPDR